MVRHQLKLYKNSNIYIYRERERAHISYIAANWQQYYVMVHAYSMWIVGSYIVQDQKNCLAYPTV